MSTYDKDKVSKLIAEIIKELPGFATLEEPVVSDVHKRFALASMYKDKSYRSYLKGQIYNAVSALQGCTDEISVARQSSRILVLKELYNLSKEMFNDVAKMDKSFKE